MEQIGFLVDLSKCIGCKACEIACTNRQHLVAPGPRPRRVRTTEEGTFPDTKVINLSLSCMHCADPACVANCPAGALSKDENAGSVKVDVNRGIGCKTCSQVCPFDVPQYREEEGTMAKCDLCGDRRQMGLDPACVQTCFNNALKVGPLESLRQEAAGRSERKLDESTEVSVIIVE